MILLLEGPDFAGKTSIADELKEYHRRGILVPDSKTVNFVKMTFCEDCRLEKTFDYIRQSANYDVNVWDRCYFPSDLIYSPIVEHKQSIIATRRWRIEYEMLMAGTVIVFVTADIDTLKKRAVRGDEYIQATQLADICSAYVEFLASTVLPWRLINTTNKDVDSCMREVLSIIDEHL